MSNEPVHPVRRPGEGRGALIGLAALFFVPLLGAFWLYYAGGWRPAGSTNHGELIAPVISLASPRLHTLDGEPVRPDFFRKQWLLVYIGDGRCDQKCQNALWMMRQTRLLLGEDMDRVRRVFVADANCCDNDFLQREHPGLETLTVIDEADSRWLADFPRTPDLEYIYIVDPLGNLMMRFNSAENPKGLLSDLEKLLKLSSIG